MRRIHARFSHLSADGTQKPDRVVPARWQATLG